MALCGCIVLGGLAFDGAAALAADTVLLRLAAADAPAGGTGADGASLDQWLDRMEREVEAGGHVKKPKKQGPSVEVQQQRALKAARKAAVAKLGTAPTRDAIDYGRAEAQADPGNFSLRLRLVDLLIKYGDLAEADTVAAALSEDPLTADEPTVRQRALIKRVTLALKQDNIPAARTHLAALKDYDSSPEYQTRIAELSAKIDGRDHTLKTRSRIGEIGPRATGSALAAARELYESDPDNIDAALYYADLLGDDMQVAKAETIYQSILAKSDGIDPKAATRARLGLASLYVKTNRIPSAQRLLDEVSGASPTPGQSERLAALRGRIDEQLKPNQWTAALSASVGYDTDAQSRSILQADEDTDEVVQKQPSSLQAVAGEFEYLGVLNGRGDAMRVAGGVEQTWYNAARDYDRSSLELYAGPRFRVPGARLIIDAGVGYRHRLRGYDFYRSTTSAFVAMDQVLSYRLRLLGSYAFEYNEDAQDTRDGLAHAVGLEARYQVSAQDQLAAEILLRDEIADAEFESRYVYGTELKYRHEFRPDLTAKLTLGVRRSEYRGTSLRPEDLGKTRDDIDWRVDGMLSYWLTPQFAIEPRAGYLQRTSSIERYERRSTRVLLTVTQNF